MYLASLYIYFDLDPSMVSADKDRLLLSLREKLKQKFKNKFASQIDEVENSLAIAFFNQNNEKINAYVKDIIDYLESTSEARLSSHTSQVFTWFNGQFIDSDQTDLFNLSSESNQTNHSRRAACVKEVSQKTIVYSDTEEDDINPIPSRFARRHLRLPTRK